MEQVCSHYPEEERKRIMDAYAFAESAHDGALRKSGEPYIIHPVQTALIIAQMGLDSESVMAGLLHDTIEDTSATYEDIRKRMGESVAEMVDGVTRLGRIKYESKEEEQMEDLRKMFVAMAKDIRVILIKLADRLHNMRTIEFHNIQKQREISLETMEIYAPLAHRLGMTKIENELEDISLKILDPVGYAEIMDYLRGREDELTSFIDETSQNVKGRLDDAGIEAEIKHRVKHIYSIYRKMYGQNLNFSDIYDLCAIRVIVSSIPECYNVLGIIHDMYTPVFGRFKDYISTPKPNGYQSLHTVVIGTKGIPFEVQIRTREMDHSAEYGIAAHWKYKDNLKGKQKEETFAWLRQLIENQQDSEAEDFIKNIKVDLFAEDVYVFTPKGDVITLPQGATPIDFAYAIHSGVGNSMVGAKVNGRIVNIDYQLNSGEVVDIITSKTAGGPKRDWMKICKTGTARNKIKQWYKKERREENVQHGRQELERELRVNLLWDDYLQDDVRAELLKRMELSSEEDLYAAVGYGGTSVNRVIAKIREIQDRKKAETTEETVTIGQRQGTDSGVSVEGLDNCMIKFAKCCQPLPGDPIVGFVTRGSGVSVHRRECPNYIASIKKGDGDRWIKTVWNYGERNRFESSLKISAKSRVGALGDVVSVFANMKINVLELNARDNPDGLSNFYVTLEVRDLAQLDALMNRLMNNPSVAAVERRITGG